MGLSGWHPAQVGWQVSRRVATITLDRPQRKNALTFEVYEELRNVFTRLADADEVGAVVLTGAGGNFCSGGDVHDIIGPLVNMDMVEKLRFTRLTGDVVAAMRHCPQPIVAAIDGVAAGAGACLAIASDIRYGTPRASIAFLFNKVGLAGSDMGACALLPRLVGQGRAAELLYTGRALAGEEAERWGLINRLCAAETLLQEAQDFAHELASGPTFANAMTKRMLHQEWGMPLDEAIEAEAQAQAICMQTQDFARAYRAFVARQRPTFEGN